MRIRTVDVAGTPTVCVWQDGRTLRVDRLLDGPPRDLVTLLAEGLLDQLAGRLGGPVADDAVVDSAATVLAPSTRPGKILGIGLNYGAHAGDLGEQAPRSSPASFLKANHTIAGPGEPIRRPDGIGAVTAEAEVGLVIGRPCYRVGVDEAMSYVAGICAVLDQTAEGVLLENPRYLTRVKNYPTFFSYGPDVITLDEVTTAVGGLADLRVSTVLNGEVHRTDTVAGMTFSPAELLSFHSHVMPFAPGDILATGTPGAAPIQPGDEVRCVLGDGFSELTNPVIADPT